jgi:hypothetical protein
MLGIAHVLQHSIDVCYAVRYSQHSELAAGDLSTNAEETKECQHIRTDPLTPARGDQAAPFALKTVDPEGWQFLVDDIAAQDPMSYLPTTYDDTLNAGAKV